MRKTKQIFAVAFVVLGALLLAKAVAGGLWPPSLQLIAGASLVVYGMLRWWTL
jgi:hypothetical protein